MIKVAEFGFRFLAALLVGLLAVLAFVARWSQ